MPKPKTVAVRKDRKPKPLYRQKTPKIQADNFVHAEPIVPAHFALREDGTIDVATHHVIFSIGYAMQQLGFKILNDIAWEKPNPAGRWTC